jgi:menaquinone-dependent protoporphyrinogen oxidase
VSAVERAHAEVNDQEVMGMTVLVAVASKYGATFEIAEAIGRGLRERGIVADVEHVEDVDEIVGYDAVVLGSAVYAGRWLQQARKLVDERVGELSALPVWLFSSGPIGSPPKPEPDEAVQIDKIASLVDARDHRVFAGQLVKERLSFPERAIVRAFHAAEGDFRNWEEIDAWAGRIAEALTGTRVKTSVSG